MKCGYAECGELIAVILTVLMQNVVMLNVVILCRGAVLPHMKLRHICVIIVTPSSWCSF